MNKNIFKIKVPLISTATLLVSSIVPIVVSCSSNRNDIELNNFVANIFAFNEYSTIANSAMIYDLNALKEKFLDINNPLNTSGMYVSSTSPSTDTIEVENFINKLLNYLKNHQTINKYLRELILKWVQQKSLVQ